MIKNIYRKVRINNLFNNIEVILKKLGEFKSYRSSAENVNTKVFELSHSDLVPGNKYGAIFLFTTDYTEITEICTESLTCISPIVNNTFISTSFFGKSCNSVVRPNFLSINQISSIILDSYHIIW